MRWNDHGDTFILPRMTTLDSVMRYVFEHGLHG